MKFSILIPIWNNLDFLKCWVESIRKTLWKTTKEFQESELLLQLPKMKKEDWSGFTWPPNLMHRNMWKAIGGYGEEFSSDPSGTKSL